MGTRGVIAKPYGDGWQGRYHHWDSYPSGLGLSLLQAYETLGHDETVRKLVDNEPVGWSTINGADLTMAPCWYDGKPPEPHGPLSYTARGEREGDEQSWITHDSDASGTEWAYVITPRGLLVFEGDIGAFGMGGGNWKAPKFVAWGDVDAMQALQSAWENDDE